MEARSSSVKVDLETSRARPVGAYGFRLEGAGQRLLLPAQPGWPSIRLSQEIVERVAPPALEIGSEHATVPLICGGKILIDRDPPAATLKLPHRLTEDQIAHPYLSPIASVHAHWLGRQTFHGGGIVIEERAWGVLGQREAGKSSLLAEAVRQGVPVLTDDLLVTDGPNVFAGPRSVDLREPAAHHFGVGRPLGVVGRRERWRVELPTVPPSFPLAGWVFLRWGQTPGAKTLGLKDRLSRLAANRTVRVGSADPGPLLRLAALPALELTAVKRWDALPDLFESLLEAIVGLESPA